MGGWVERATVEVGMRTHVEVVNAGGATRLLSREGHGVRLVWIILVARGGRAARRLRRGCGAE